MRSDNLAVVGLGFGDEGKGQILNYIAQKKYKQGYRIFEKSNGGCQGKHTVKLNDGFFSFSQLSPGILNKDSIVLLGPNFVFEPFALLNEVDCLAKRMRVGRKFYLERIFIDNNAICVTPIHKLYNVIEEESKENNRGSVGTGVSIAGLYSEDESFTIRAKDLLNVENLQKKLENQIRFFSKLCLSLNFDFEKIDKFDVFDYIEGIKYIVSRKCLNIIDIYNKYDGTNLRIFETSQGILIDKNFGIKPNITYLDINPSDRTVPFEFEKLGIIRSIYTRHGKGIFPTESLELKEFFSDKNQEVGRFSGELRFGWFDLVLFNYALRMSSVAKVVMTCLDYLKSLDSIRVCKRYEYRGKIDDIVLCLLEFDEKENKYVNRIIKNDIRLIEYLKLCKPIYEEISLKGLSLDERIEKYIGFIEKNAEIQIVAYSKGLNFTDVVERKNYEI